MKHIAYFKQQAKNLFKDYKTKAPYIHGVYGFSSYKYNPKYYDIEGILLDYDYDEDDFTLMKAQHVIALMCGFSKWTELSKASEAELNLAKAIFDNPDKININDWEMYIDYAEREAKATFDSESKLEILKLVFLDGEPLYPCPHRLNQSLGLIAKDENPQQSPILRPDVQIKSLPLNKEDRAEFIETANSVFETVMALMEAGNPELTRKLWDVEGYVDNLLTGDMLPISRDYALSLIEPFMVQLVAALAARADKMIE